MVLEFIYDEKNFGRANPSIFLLSHSVSLSNPLSVESDIQRISAAQEKMIELLKACPYRE